MRCPMRDERLWQEPEIELALTLSHEMMSASQIARELAERMGGPPRSRNSVIGKLFRLQAAGADVGMRQGPSRRTVIECPAVPLPRVRKVRPAAGSVAATSVDFIQRRHGQCSYPLWPDTERGGFVCGAPVMHGQSMCDEHCRLCFYQR
jgi:hypothetical protein